MPSRQFQFVIAAIGAAFIAAVYLPDLGAGFVKDDCLWVVTAAGTLHHPAALFTVDSSGFFFRPLVTASFALDYVLHGVNARGYGLTNLALCIGCVAAIVMLFRELGASAAAAAVGALAWAVNPHGIGMALLWISGRTSLLMTLCSVFSILAFLRGQRVIGAVLLLCAMCAKEDAIAVPVLAFACAYAAGRAGTRELPGLMMSAAWMTAAEAVYFALRMRTSAMTPATAPWYYQLLTSPWHIAINGLSYLDRAATGAAVIVCVAAVVYGARPVLTSRARRGLAVAALWFAAGLAITVRIPVRSDLYAVFPSIGAALACAIASDAFRGGSRNAAAGDRILAGALAALLLLVPVYWTRDARFTEPALLSARMQHTLTTDLATLPDRGMVVLQDEATRFGTFGDAFDGMATSALQLFTGRPFTAEIVTPEDQAVRPGEAARYRLSQGRIERIR